MRNIIFVSEIQDPDDKGSSTQIMTKNILEGFQQNNYNVHFIGIIDTDCDTKNVIRNYKPLVNSITIINTKLNLRLIKNKYVRLFKMLLSLYKSYKYKGLIDEIDFSDDTLLISHSPSIESILVCMQIVKKNKNIKFYEYWSDPISLSGIYPENFNVKRYLHYVIENKLLKVADEIIYGTPTLYEFQKKLFKQYQNKMRYINVSYSQSKHMNRYQKSNKKLLLGYTGQYMKDHRNIIPLYNSCGINKQIDLMICGSGDVKLDPTDNIQVISTRYSQNKISEIEDLLDVVVCILNSNCIQIPGKIFYHTNENKIILVILDGKYSDLIYSYLKKFDRFVFCYNNEKSINDAIERIVSGEFELNFKGIEQLSPKYITKELART